MAVDRDDWRGLLKARHDPVDVPVIEVPLQSSPRGGSGTFLAADDDGRRWWIKPLNNRQGGKVVVSEQAVARAGALIGAPVCEVAVVRLPDELEGWEFCSGHFVEPGLAHGSSAVDQALEERSLSYRERDENAKRHAGVFALHDWCWGGDDQWLYAELRDRMIFSHDHGWYLPENGNTWSEATLEGRVDDAHQGGWASDDLDMDELGRLANALRSVSRSDLVEILIDIPATWPVSTDELEALGWFLERRTEPVADRLESMRGGSQ